MARLEMSNSSSSTGLMTDSHNRNRAILSSGEVRRSQNTDVQLSYKGIFAISRTKESLRNEKPLLYITLGLPNCREVSGNGGLVVATVSKRYYTTRVMSGECEGVQSNHVLNKDILNASGDSKKTTINNKKKSQGLYKKLCTRNVLEFAYELVSKAKGANTVGSNNETLDGYSKKHIEEEIKLLKSHQRKFKPTRRVYIAKAKGGKIPLGIPNPRDKVLQKAMALILEEVYEKLFLNCSHGFRPKRGTHSALKEVTK